MLTFRIDMVYLCIALPYTYKTMSAQKILDLTFGLPLENLFFDMSGRCCFFRLPLAYPPRRMSTQKVLEPTFERPPQKIIVAFLADIILFTIPWLILPGPISSQKIFEPTCERPPETSNLLPLRAGTFFSSAFGFSFRGDVGPKCLCTDF